MKQIYRFDSNQPPTVSEKMLRAEIERRKVLRQTVLLALAGVSVELCLFITGLILQPVNAVLSTLCIAYACVAVCGNCVIAIVFTQRRRNLI